jgi:pimeloyl-ACP methyl ester carboxylesterase
MPEVQSHPCFLTPRQLNPGYPLFVFLPGMDGTGKLLRTQTAGLEATFDIRCLAIPPDDLTSWDVLSERVVALIQAELEAVPRQSIYLCGESFGGCLALKVALKAPHLFKRIILVNPASSYNQRPWIHWGCHLTRWLPQSLYQVSSVGLLPFLAALDRISPSDRQALLSAMRSVPQKTSIWRLSLLGQFEIDQTQLRRLTQPVLLIASEADRLLPSLTEAQHLAKSLSKARIVTLPYSGHACLLEADINLYEILKSVNFLDDLEQPILKGVVSSDY